MPSIKGHLDGYGNVPLVGARELFQQARVHLMSFPFPTALGPALLLFTAELFGTLGIGIKEQIYLLRKLVACLAKQPQANSNDEFSHAGSMESIGLPAAVVTAAVQELVESSV